MMKFGTNSKQRFAGQPRIYIRAPVFIAPEKRHVRTPMANKTGP